MGGGTCCRWPQPAPRAPSRWHIAHPHPPPSPRSPLLLLLLQVEQVVQQSGKQLGVPLRVGGFVRVQVGEGLEAESKDFAAEVAETLKAAA